MKNQRPVYLNLFQFRFPVTAIASILHRISGVVLFLFIPLMLWALDRSLTSDYFFANVKNLFSSTWMRFVVWVMLAGFTYHLLGGIRHLLMDLEIGESHRGGRIGAYLVLVLATVLIILEGIWLW